MRPDLDKYAEALEIAAGAPITVDIYERLFFWAYLDVQSDDPWFQIKDDDDETRRL